MKTQYPYIILMALLCFISFNSINAQETRAAAKTEKLKKFYNTLLNPEISLREFLKIHSSETLQNLGAFNGCGTLHDPCGNGGFETGLDPTQWQGAYGTWGNGDPDPATLTEGLISGSLFSSSAHQTVVGIDVDPIVGIKTVSDSGGTQALRLGNAVNGSGTELISKTIKITNETTIFSFAYAVVFQDPKHLYEEQPAFSVRAFDCATGEELKNVCDLGDSSYKIVSNASNPFFQSITHPNYGLIAYRDWTSSYVDLSDYIGRTVNIQFTNKDCGPSAHFGYTYIDNFCGAIISNGYVIPNTSKTDTCGIGSVCADYGLPKAADSTLGSVVLHLKIYQSGSLVNTITTDTLTKDSSTYCFNIDPLKLGLDTSLGGFDYVITNNFVLKGFPYTIPPMGNPPDGQITGANNDYKISCASSDTNCKNVCLADNFKYIWRLCYQKQDSKYTATGTVNIGPGVLWKAYGWLNCNTGALELHAVNPNPDNCASGYTDSFTYRGITPAKCKMTDIHIGAGIWRSYCSGTVTRKGLVGIINCGAILGNIKYNSTIMPAQIAAPSKDIVLKVSPNPIQNFATISYTLAKENKISIVVYNYMMQPVKTLVNTTKPQGNYSVTWDTRKSDGTSAGAGFYKIVAIADNKLYTATVQVMK